MNKKEAPITTNYISPDGIIRHPNEEHRINSAFAAMAKEPYGKTVLDYLRSITLNRVSGPEISDHALRHLEGQRHLVATIEARCKDGALGQPPMIKKESQNGRNSS